MSARPELSVLWREGTFLCPQHFQAFARELSARISHGDAVGAVGSYGLAELTVDLEALGRDVFQIESATVFFQDGSQAVFPTTASVEPRDFSEFLDGPELPVYLGVPTPQSNVPQVPTGGSRPARYSVESVPVFDENARDASREVEFRMLRGRLFFGPEDRTGYECLPIGKIVRRGRPEARSVLSPDYIPPVVACRGSDVLVAELAKTAERVGVQARDLASRLPSTESLSNVQSGADLKGFLKLQAVNGSVTSLQQVAGLIDLHPLNAYLALVRAVGDLAIFSPDRVPPDLPVYDHDNLTEAFGAVFKVLPEMLASEDSVPYDTASFQRDPDKEGFLECRVPTDWCKGNTVFYLGVELAQSADEVQRQVQSGVKLVASGDIERVLQGVVPGVELEHARIPPVSFPKRKNLHFFKVQSEGATRDAWLRVLESRTAVLISALDRFGEVGYDFYVELHS